jgi:hypothetical protein
MEVEMGTSKAVAALTVTGFTCEPEKISSQLETAPTRVWKIGDPVVASRPEARKHRENGWRYVVEVAEGDEEAALWLERALQQLVRFIVAKQACFARLPSESSVEVSCYVRIDGKTSPVIAFDKEAVKVIAAIGGSIDVDLMIV